MSAKLFFDGIMWSFYLFLWAVTVYRFLKLSWSNTYFAWGAIFISAIVLPGQINDIWKIAWNCLILEFFILCVMFFVFDDRLRLTARAFMGFTLGMMIVNSVYILYPPVLESFAIWLGPIEGHALTGNFVRENLLNLLYVLQCVSVIYWSWEEGRRDERYAYQEV